MFGGWERFILKWNCVLDFEPVVYDKGGESSDRGHK